MITLTKKSDNEVWVNTSSNQIDHATREEIVETLVLQGATVKDAKRAIDALLSGTVDKVTVGK